MKIRPEASLRLRMSACAAVALAALALGCSARMKAPVLDARAATFLETRLQPPPAEAGAEGGSVEVTGAVAQPGQFALDSSLQTLREALAAAGGPNPTAGLIRIRSRDAVRSEVVPGGLFAPGADDSVIDVPLVALGEMPMYLHAGDVIEVAYLKAPGAEAPAAAAPKSDAAPVAEPVNPPAAAPAPVAAAAPVAPVSPPVVTPPPPVAATAEELKPPGVDEAAVRTEVAKVRAEFEGKLAALRAELERLEQEQSRLTARLERSATVAAVAGPAAKPPIARAAATAPAEKAAPADKSAAKDETAPPARPATVLVSGSVRNPGSYSIDDVKTVRGAVRAAGDRPDANLSAVEIRPEGQRGALVGMGLGLGAPPAKTVVNLVAVESGKGSDVPLRGGEVIFVPVSPRSDPMR